MCIFLISNIFLTWVKETHSYLCIDGKLENSKKDKFICCFDIIKPPVFILINPTFFHNSWPDSGKYMGLQTKCGMQHTLYTYVNPSYFFLIKRPYMLEYKLDIWPGVITLWNVDSPHLLSTIHNIIHPWCSSLIQTIMGQSRTKHL